jgi:hypothetical protein
MLLRLLYAEAGVQPPAGDLYLGIAGLGPEHRPGIKQVISAMLFRTSPLTRFPRGTRKLFPTKGWGARRVEKAIMKRHEPVAGLFYSTVDARTQASTFQHNTPIGFRLFWRESEVLLAALRQCQAAGVVALPVHDAVIVKESCAEQARRIMLAAFKEVTGFEGQVGEPKRPGDDADALIDTVLDANGELPVDTNLEERLKSMERADAEKAARDYLASSAPDTAASPDGADDSELW